MKKARLRGLAAQKSTGSGAQVLRSPKDVISFYKLNWPILLLIGLISLIVYAPSLAGQFVTADDMSSIVQNPKLRDFGEIAKSWNIIAIATSALINVFGLSPVAFHLSSVGLHLLNVYLVMLLAYLLFGKRIALYASFIFCLLPSGSEAIFWISGRAYLFHAFFTFLCLNLFFLYRTTGHTYFLKTSALLYVFALITLQTPWMFSVPFIILVLDIFCPRPILYKVALTRWKQYGIFFLIMGVYWGIFMSGQLSLRVSGLAVDYYSDPTKSTALLTRLPYTVYKTVELYVFPVRLSLFHEEALTRPVYYLMISVSVCTFVFLAYLVYKKSKYAGLVLAIFASMAPVFSPVQVAWFIAERYLYLGGAFWAIILSLLIIKLDSRFNVQNLAGYVLSVILILYSIRLVTRANDFKSSKNLWVATQKTAPFSYRVYNNLGDVFSNERNWPAAIDAFQTAIRLAPNYFDAIHNLGYTYLLMGDYDNAKTYLLQAFEINPKLYQAAEKLGQIEYAEGNIEKAREYFNKVRELNPQIQGLPNI